MARRATRESMLSPTTVSLIVLVIIFATEYLVMLILPWMLPPNCPLAFEAAVDAISLIAVLSPLIWWTVLRPLREIIRLRTKFVLDLFTYIEADRKKTANELHDGVGQPLSLLISSLRTAGGVPLGTESNTRYTRLHDLAQSALDDLKRLTQGLRPAMLDDLGLAPALERLMADVRDLQGLEFTLDVRDLVGERYSEEVEIAVFRIVQEGLANIVRHASATYAAVVISQEGDMLRVAISDNGRGFEPSQSTTPSDGLGLIGMRERATLLGGEFSLITRPGRGVRIVATVPGHRKVVGHDTNPAG